MILFLIESSHVVHLETIILHEITLLTVQSFFGILLFPIGNITNYFKAELL